MKCPYRDFKECIVEKCPACNYEEIKNTVVEGRHPSYMSTERAIKEGISWESVKTTYKFISCDLVANNVQPMPAKQVTVNNTTRTSVAIKKSIF